MAALRAIVVFDLLRGHLMASGIWNRLGVHNVSHAEATALCDASGQIDDDLRQSRIHRAPKPTFIGSLRDDLTLFTRSASVNQG
jgi:hypothetical protein